MFKSSIAILLFTWVSFCSAQLSTVETSVDSNSKIVGGTVAASGRYPYAVGLLSSKYGTPFCGGTLVTPNVVFTAAHCGTAKYVLTGCVNVASSSCSVIAVKSSIVHPEFNSETLQMDYQVITLASNSTAEPIPYVADEGWSEVDAGTDATVIGWGATSYEGSTSLSLREVVLDIVSNNECSQDYESYNYIIDDSMICAYRSGKDSCQGDSGGALLYSCSETGDILIGSVSWGVGCAFVGYPGVYGRISYGSAWFRTQLEGLGQFLATPPSVLTPCSPRTGSPTAPTTVSPSNSPTFKPTTSPTAFITTTVPTPFPSKTPEPTHNESGSSFWYCLIFYFMC